MSEGLKWLFMVLTLTVNLVLPLSFINASGVYAAESLAQQTAKSFLTNVIQLDLAKYNVTLLYDELGHPTEFADITQEKVRYLLKAKGSELDVTFVYRNNILAFATIYVNPNGSPVIYTHPQPTDLIDATKGLLERYQLYTGSLQYKEMIDVLNYVGKVENKTVTRGNMKLKIFAKGSLVSFQWTYIVDELEKPGLGIVFRHGNVETFNNQWNLFKIGSTTINISEEEAVSIARNCAENFSWKVGLESDAQEVKNFNILNTPVKAELSLQTRESLTLYPFWRVTLYFDKTYPGNIIGIVVGVWADTGEVRYIEALSTGGMPPPEIQPNANQTTEPQITKTSSIVAVAGTMLIGIIIALFIKKKRLK